MKNEQTRCAASQDEAFVLTRVIVCSSILVGVLVAGAWFVVDWPFARSLLIGGVLVNASFLLLKRDAQRLIQKVSVAETTEPVVVSAEKTRFFLRTCARLIVLGLLLFALAAHMPINVIGLTLGCATIVVSIVIIGLSAGKCWMPSKV
jgi:hypothetical protein